MAKITVECGPRIAVKTHKICDENRRLKSTPAGVNRPLELVDNENVCFCPYILIAVFIKFHGNSIISTVYTSRP